jgi:hypothetical protein
MNRGTALKWADHLEKFDAIAGYDNSVLSFHGPDGLLWISPVGVLADFLDPEAWRHEYRFHGSREWHGEIIKIPESCQSFLSLFWASLRNSAAGTSRCCSEPPLSACCHCAEIAVFRQAALQSLILR